MFSLFGFNGYFGSRDRAWHFVRLLLLASLPWVAAACHAAPEEIQVYLDEFAEPGEFGLDIHTNFVPSAQPGSATFRQLRATPELSYGINQNVELGLYVLTSASPAISGGRPVTDGAKARIKWRPRPPSEDSPWYFAVNWEVGHLAKRFNADVSSTQLKFIGVYRQGPWLGGVNFNLNGSLRSHPLQSSSTELDYKLTYQLTPESHGDLRVGFERYNTLGLLHNNISLPSPHTTSNFLVADFNLGHWDFDFGIGRSYGALFANSDRTVIKLIVGVPI